MPRRWLTVPHSKDPPLPGVQQSFCKCSSSPPPALATPSRDRSGSENSRWTRSPSIPILFFAIANLLIKVVEQPRSEPAMALFYRSIDTLPVWAEIMNLGRGDISLLHRNEVSALTHHASITTPASDVHMTRGAVTHVTTHGASPGLNMLRQLGIMPLPPNSVTEWTWLGDTQVQAASGRARQKVRQLIQRHHGAGRRQRGFVTNC